MEWQGSESLRWTLWMMFLSAASAMPAQTAAPAVPLIHSSETVRVTTAMEPVPLEESERSVQMLTSAKPPEAGSAVDLLREDPSLNLQAREGMGVQADLSIRGTTFEQSLVLVNGMRVNDPETGHLNLDIPVPLDAIGRIDVLHGSGSTFYGSDAIGGAVNLLTFEPGTGWSVTARSGAGNYGSLEEHLGVGYAGNRLAEQVTGSRDTSDGFMADRNYSSNALSSETWVPTPLGTTDVLLAGSDRPYGADQFYGPYDSRERTKGWLASVQQQLGERTSSSFGYRKHSDEFVLFSENPAIYENNHVTTSWEAAVRRADELGKNAVVAYGLEADGDGIRSNSLGHHGRNQGAGYANVGLRAVKRFSFSAGARLEVLSGNGAVFSPSAGVAYTLTKTLRLRGSIGHGFRLPTYVDLYYADPATVGNPALKPESSWSYEGGLEWRPGRITVTATGFRLQQKDAIDYSKPQLATAALTAAQPWQAVNVQSLGLTGAEAMVSLPIGTRQTISLGYTAIQASGAPPGRVSEYAFNYAAQNAVLRYGGLLPGQWGRQVRVSTQVNVVQRTTRVAYPLWDASIARDTGRLRPYVRLTNLSNTGYQEIVGVAMQGRAVMGGLEWDWRGR